MQLAAPVRVKGDPVFPTQSFGAGIVPFYATLVLWIDALLSSVLIRTTVRSCTDQKVGDAVDVAGADQVNEAWTDAVDGETSDEIATDASNGRTSATPTDDYTRVKKFPGRFATFASVGLAQTTPTVLGFQMYVGIEPAHLFLMLLTG